MSTTRRKRKTTRRAFLAAASVASGALLAPGVRTADDVRTRLVLLGTGGGPRPRRASSAAAQVIVSGDRVYSAHFRGRIIVGRDLLEL